MSTNKGCAPGKSSLIGLGLARDYDGCAILQRFSDVKMVNLSASTNVNQLTFKF